MPELLLELLSEEIPARMQARAADDLKRLVTGALVDAGVTYEQAAAFATPRRLALAIDGLPARQPDTREERKGPRVGAPDKAIEGFLKSAGLDSLDQCETREDAKGAFHVAIIERGGKATPELVAEIVPEAVRKFPWPKAMRWGEGGLRWVRPLHAIVCTFGASNEEPDVVDFEIDGIKAGNTTRGHRFLDGEAITVSRFDDYVAKLEKARVVLDREQRKRMIAEDANTLAFAQGLELIEDQALLDEVAGLVEWPVVLMGAFDEAFLELPPEVLMTAMKAHQKCFSVKNAETGKLAARFITVANITADDDGAAIRAGNERVIAARLSDARFFWTQDLKVPLDARAEALDGMVFHENLGTQADRVARITALARELAPAVGADPEMAARAAALAKADLMTEMVGEFPELQGLMGRYYAEGQGEDPAVARAIEEHYRPQGPSDGVPDDPVAIAVALADKLDMLVGFWAIDEKPTGSKDPYALRRAALGVIAIVLENDLRLHLNSPDDWSQLGDQPAAQSQPENLIDKIFESMSKILDVEPRDEEARLKWCEEKALDLLDFFHDRLKVYMREQGARHDLIDAVIAVEGQDDLLMIVRRVEALGRFLDTGDGATLLAGVKRASNILKIEEKKDGTTYDGAPDPALFAQAEESALASAIADAGAAAQTAIAKDDFEAAMAAMAKLRAPVDAFFDAVTVNADDPALRVNRLRLLAQIRTATREVADFTKIGG